MDTPCGPSPKGSLLLPHQYTFPSTSKDGHACASTPPAGTTAGQRCWLPARGQAGPPAPGRARLRAVAAAAELLHQYREKQPQRRGSVPCQKRPRPPRKLKALADSLTAPPHAPLRDSRRNPDGPWRPFHRHGSERPLDPAQRRARTAPGRSGAERPGAEEPRGRAREEAGPAGWEL